MQSNSHLPSPSVKRMHNFYNCTVVEIRKSIDSGMYRPVQYSQRFAHFRPIPARYPHYRSRLELPGAHTLAQEHLCSLSA